MGLFSSISDFVKKKTEDIVDGVKDIYQKQQLTADIDKEILKLKKELYFSFNFLNNKEEELKKLKNSCPYSGCAYWNKQGKSYTSKGQESVRNCLITLTCPNKQVKVLHNQIEESQQKRNSHRQDLNRQIALLEERKKFLLECYEARKERAEHEKEFEQHKKEIQNEDMVRLEQIIKETIPKKLSEIDKFNGELTSAIDRYNKKGNQIVKVTYGNLMSDSDDRIDDLFNSYDKIHEEYCYKIDNTLMLTCDASIKKIRNLIREKEDLVAQNNTAKAKYEQLYSELQKRYDDEYKIQELKHINNDINSEIDNTSDIANAEENKHNIQSLINDVELLNLEIDERRKLEAINGIIEI